MKALKTLKAFETYVMAFNEVKSFVKETAGIRRM